MQGPEAASRSMIPHQVAREVSPFAHHPAARGPPSAERSIHRILEIVNWRLGQAQTLALRPPVGDSAPPASLGTRSALTIRNGGNVTAPSVRRAYTPSCLR